MKKFVSIFVVALSLVIMLSCNSINSCQKGSGEIDYQIRNLSYFESVELMTTGNVFISQGEAPSVTIEAAKDVIDEIKTNVDNNSLNIFSETGICPDKMNIYITMKDINSLKVFGSGNIYNFTPLITDELNLKISGSGNIVLTDVASQKVGLLIMGSGNIKVNGSSESTIIEVSGTGNVNASELLSKYCDILVNGSGETKTFVEKDLKVKIKGSGNVKYLGEPERIKKDIDGTGEIKKLKAVS
jgi:hypothetical protein